VDLSPRLLAVAKRRVGDLRLTCANMLSLPVRSRSCSGVVAYYSLQHLPRAALSDVLAEIRRVLKPGGLLVIATHLGQGEIFLTEFLGHTIDAIGGTFYGDGELELALAAGSFVVDDARYRDARAHEHQSRRIYLTATLATDGDQ
jgi:ubiquinone/menaquinone biosynthesis C-methylase UbiE